jgi:hypothetical protein
MGEIMLSKKGVGRPRLPKTKKKSKVIAVRVTEKQKDDMLVQFESVQKFFEEAILKLLNGRKLNEED